MDTKRKANVDDSGDPNKPSKSSKKWHSPQARPKTPGPTPALEPGISGIWVTCERGREGRCVPQVRELFNQADGEYLGPSHGGLIERGIFQYASKLYGDAAFPHGCGEGQGPSDIEADIRNEVQSLEASVSEPIFQHIKLGMKCVLFFKTRSPVDPVALVREICADARDDADFGRIRYVQRLTPTTLTARATERGLDEMAATVLDRHFHAHQVTPRTFAIRVNIRNHDTMKRDAVIDRVAKAVGDRHSVDLDSPDLLVLLEISHNTLGMAVVDSSFTDLKRYNLAAIFDSRETKNPHNLES